jgi:hypothetical protein
MASIEIHEPRTLSQTMAANTHCGNGHPWKASTTRWRRRYGGRRSPEGTVERDCLVCRDEAKRKARAASTLSTRHYMPGATP